MDEEYQIENMPEDEAIAQNEDDELSDSYIDDRENELLTDDIESNNEDVFFCPKCSHIISKNTHRCPKCGNQFSDGFEDELDELIHSNLDDVILEDDIVLTENDLSSMEDNLEKLVENKPKAREAVRECIVCGAMLFEGYKVCPVCGESTGVE
jgi:rubrerythrin